MITNPETDHSLMTGDIISAQQAWVDMTSELSNLHNSSIWIISAYLKTPALDALAGFIDASNDVSIISRWQPNDLISGSSDIDAFNIAANNNWRFFVRLDLHAKIYRVGNKSIYVGSANLTNSGYYAPEGRGNAESMVRVAATNANISAVASFFKPTIELDALIVNQLKVWLTACADKSVPPSMANKDFPLFNLNRSSSLMRPTNLMVSECFYTSADWLKAIVPAVSATLGDDQKHDLSLLGFATEDMPVNDSKSLMELFKRTKIFSWLYGSLADSANNEMYFGELTVNLHSALVDDPRPYRKDVKLMLANLIGWVEALSDCGISVDRPQYSQRVFLAAVDKS